MCYFVTLKEIQYTFYKFFITARSFPNKFKQQGRIICFHILTSATLTVMLQLRYPGSLKIKIY